MTNFQYAKHRFACPLEGDELQHCNPEWHSFLKIHIPRYWFWISWLCWHLHNCQLENGKHGYPKENCQISLDSKIQQSTLKSKIICLHWPHTNLNNEIIAQVGKNSQKGLFNVGHCIDLNFWNNFKLPAKSVSIFLEDVLFKW